MQGKKNNVWKNEIFNQRSNTGHVHEITDNREFLLSPERASERSHPWQDGHTQWTAVNIRQNIFTIYKSWKKKHHELITVDFIIHLTTVDKPAAAAGHPLGCSGIDCRSEKKKNINVKPFSGLVKVNSNNDTWWDPVTWIELVMVLSAKMVAQSLTVDWLSKAPWVSISTTATYRTEITLHEMRIENSVWYNFIEKKNNLIKQKYYYTDLKSRNLIKENECMKNLFCTAPMVKIISNCENYHQEHWNTMRHSSVYNLFSHTTNSTSGTSLPSALVTGKTSLHSWMPVVSGSEPPLQENPDSGSSSCPSQSSLSCRNEI